MRKQIVLSLFLLLIVSVSHAQTRNPPDTTAKNLNTPDSLYNYIPPGEISISPGIGYGALTFDGPLSKNVQAYPTYPYMVHQTAEYGGSVDVAVTGRVSFGLAANYQACIIDEANSYQDEIARFNMGIRLLRYFDDNYKENSNLFVGLRMGLSMWNEYNISKAKYFDPVVQDYQNKSVYPSVQILCGFREYINYFLALHVEAGIGTPYFFQTGVTFRINSKMGNEHK